ncbi:MAG: chemotaxis protein CheX [Bryobacterales bacterium]|nr:chemotaxis protein CheX [Bryobacterales bacterium]
MSFPVEAYQSETAQIVSDVFLTMLGMEVQPTPEVWTLQPGTMTAAIFFAGNWKGAVLIECSERQACRWTAKLMSIPEPEGITDDVRDAMGEIANMVGGNLKSVLPAGVGLSMPSVVQGRDYSLRICGGSNLVNRQSFAGPHGTFWITFVEVVEK